jgi:hypothetical protein
MDLVFDTTHKGSDVRLETQKIALIYGARERTKIRKIPNDRKV